MLAPLLTHTPRFFPSPSALRSAFCTSDNVVDCTQYLSGALASLHLGDLDAPSLSSFLVELPAAYQPPLLNVLHALHRSLLSARQSLSSLQSSHAALVTSHSALHSQHAELQEAHVQLDKRLWETEMRRRQEEGEHAAKEKAMRAQVAEVERRAVMVANRDKQYRVELRKRELESDKLSERVLKLLQDRSGKDASHRTERECINEPAQRSKARKEMDLTARLVQREEEKRAELLQENVAIRACLASLEAQLNAVVPAGPSLDDSCERDAEHSPYRRRVEPSVAELPWRMLERTVQKRVAQKLQAIARKTALRTNDADERPTPPSPAACARCEQRRSEAQALQRLLEEQRLLLSSQDALLVSRLFADVHPAPQSPSTRRLSLDEDIADLLHAHQRSQAALDRQREDLDAERACWEELQLTTTATCAGDTDAEALLTPLRSGRRARLESSPTPSPPTSPISDDEVTEDHADGVIRTALTYR